MRHIFIDTEFTNLPWIGKSEPFWVGLADEEHRSWSALVAEVDLAEVSAFVREAVLPRIPAHELRLSRADMRLAIIEFCGDVDEFWAWCPSAEDLIALGVESSRASAFLQEWWDWDYQLVRRLVDPWPSLWPGWCNDLHAAATAASIRRLPRNRAPHHPASDAIWNAEVFALLSGDDRGPQHDVNE